MQHCGQSRNPAPKSPEAVVLLLAALGWVHEKIGAQHEEMRQHWGALGTAGWREKEADRISHTDKQPETGRAVTYAKGLSRDSWHGLQHALKSHGKAPMQLATLTQLPPHQTAKGGRLHWGILWGIAFPWQMRVYSEVCSAPERKKTAASQSLTAHNPQHLWASQPKDCQAAHLPESTRINIQGKHHLNALPFNHRQEEQDFADALSVCMDMQIHGWLLSSLAHTIQHTPHSHPTQNQ